MLFNDSMLIWFELSIFSILIVFFLNVDKQVNVNYDFNINGNLGNSIKIVLHTDTWILIGFGWILDSNYDRSVLLSLIEFERNKENNPNG